MSRQLNCLDIQIDSIISLFVEIQADARRRKLVQLRSLDRFDVCILKNQRGMWLKLYEITIYSG